MRKPKHIRKTEDRFFEKTVRASSGCLEWAACKHSTGYGVFQYNGMAYKAHRMAYTLAFGVIPHGLLVCHKCDNRLCVEPTHLFLGTHKMNNDDKDKKNRGRYPGPKTPNYGERNPSSILRWHSIKRIRIVGSAITQPELGRLFGVSRQTISAILRGENWAQIK